MHVDLNRKIGSFVLKKQQVLPQVETLWLTLGYLKMYVQVQ